MVLALVLAASAVYFYFKAKDIGAVVAETLCPVSSGPTGFVVLLLDLTDSLSTFQASRLRQELDLEFQAAQTGTLIAVGVVSAESDNWGARIALCKPLRGTQANELYQNPALIEEKYRSGFQDPLNATIAAMLAADTEDFSPIMESLQAVLAETPEFASSDRPKKVIIVSDLLQHSEILSFYRGQYWSHFEASPNFARLSRNLSGVDVSILRLPRPGVRISNPRGVDDFWVRYFDRQGAAKVGSKPLGDL